MRTRGGRFSEGVIAISAIVAVMACLVVPLFGLGYPIGDNFEFNFPWLIHFIDQFRQGDLYPRWLTDYSNGYGAPIFYFYAPAPFFLGAAADASCAGCDLQTVLVLQHFLLYALAAAAFYFWARSLCGHRLALLCALLYSLFPYHMIDLEVRASYGEGAAYIFMPLALRGIRDAQSAGRLPILAAAAYGGVIFSHLPTAVLFSPALAIYALSSAPRGRLSQATLQLVFAGVVGALLAAAYLVPALLLRKELVTDGWIAAAGLDYAPENWLYFVDNQISASAANTRKVMTGAIAIATALACIAALIARMVVQGPSPRFSDDGNRQLRAAGYSMLFCWVMMTGAVEWLYVNFDPVRQVQFPWRVGAIVDLMAATAIAIALGAIAKSLPNQDDGPQFNRVNFVVCLAAALTALLMSANGWRIAQSSERTREFRRGVDEQLALMSAPPPMEISERRLFSEYPAEYRTRWIVSSRAYQSAFDAAASLPHVEAYKSWRRVVNDYPAAWVEGDDQGEASLVRTGPTRFDLSVTLAEPSTIRLRRAYFPNWRLHDEASGAEIALRPSESDGLMAFDLPAGEYRLTLKSAPLPAERTGGWLAAAALLCLVLLLALRRFQPALLRRVTWPIFLPGDTSRFP